MEPKVNLDAKVNCDVDLKSEDCKTIVGMICETVKCGLYVGFLCKIGELGYKALFGKEKLA